jgi:hypothetical protein
LQSVLPPTPYILADAHNQACIPIEIEVYRLTPPCLLKNN